MGSHCRGDPGDPGGECLGWMECRGREECPESPEKTHWTYLRRGLAWRRRGCVDGDAKRAKTGSQSGEGAVTACVNEAKDRRTTA